MIRALFYLRLTSLRNKISTRALRLRQPKYLAGALATVAYFYYFGFRRMNGPLPIPGGYSGRPGTAAPDIFLIIFSITILFLLIGRLMVAWALPPGRPALRFSQAEIAFLFPAPATRRMLVHYSLLNSQLTILFGALLLGLAWSRRGFSAEGAAMHVVGWWILISATSLHRSGANLTFARMAERGRNVARGKLVAIGVSGLFFTAIIVSLDREGHLPSSADLTAPACSRPLFRKPARSARAALAVMAVPHANGPVPGVRRARILCWRSGPALLLRQPIISGCCGLKCPSPKARPRSCRCQPSRKCARALSASLHADGPKSHFCGKISFRFRPSSTGASSGL